MPIVNNDLFVAAALGHVPSAVVVYKFGRRDGIGLTLEDIAPAAAYAGFIPIADAATLSFISTSILDDIASTGCQVLRISGLDENLDVQIRDYDTDGQVAVVTTGDLWSRVFRLRSRQADDRRAPNAGVITVSSTASGTPVMATMPIGLGSSLTTNFTMPAGMRGVIAVVSAGMGNNKVGDIRLMISEIVAGENRPFDVEANIPITAGPSDIRVSFVLEEKTDVIVSALALAGTVDAFLSYRIYIETNGNVIGPVI